MPPAARPQHRPLRTCIACRETQTKRGLVRLVRSPSGRVRADETGREPGRGAYICRDGACWESALSRDAIGRALRVKLSREDREALAAFADKIATRAAGCAAKSAAAEGGDPR